jgi:type VI secretion system secreted protein VgrG
MMKMRASALFVVTLLLLQVALPGAYAESIDLGTVNSFAVLGGSTVTNAGIDVVGATVITGNLGVSPGITCSGFVTCPSSGPGTVVGTLHLGDGVASLAQNDLNTAYNTTQTSTVVIAGGVLTGKNLGPGVYTSDGPSMILDGTLILDDGGVDGSIFVFKMSSTLTTEPNSTIDVSKLHPSDGLFWVVGSSATLGDNTKFAGNILADTSITFDPGATDLCGRALAGAVTASGIVSFAGQNKTSGIENQVSIGCVGVGTPGEGGGGFNGGGGTGNWPTPEPGTFTLFGTGLLLWVARRRRTSH